MAAFKFGIIVLTAHHPSRWHYREILRAQCLKDCKALGIPYKFVFGDPVRPGDWDVTDLREEEILHAPGSDQKKFLHLKDQAGMKWGLDLGLNAVMRITDDCWIYPDRILKAGLESFDLAGAFSCNFKLGGTFSIPFSRINYAHGGCGIWLSRKAAQMIVDTPWDEHYLDSWPANVDVGFGLTIPRPEWYWDDHFCGEVLQGNLAYDDPLRDQPWAAYQANGISCYADEMLFWNDEPMRPLTIHNPGVHKPNSNAFDTVKRQIRHRNIAAAMAAARVPKEQIASVGPSEGKEVPSV